MTDPVETVTPVTLLTYDRSKAVKDAQQAAVLGLHHKGHIEYTEGPLRWSGIAHHRVAASGEYPLHADCSAYVTWCLWNALKVAYGRADTVNGEHWQAGYTGTMLEHGRVVSTPEPGDAVIYGEGWPGQHVAIYTGGGLVVSHGNSEGPKLLPWNQMGIPVLAIHRYL